MEQFKDKSITKQLIEFRKLFNNENFFNKTSIKYLQNFEVRKIIRIVKRFESNGVHDVSHSLKLEIKDGVISIIKNN